MGAEPGKAPQKAAKALLSIAAPEVALPAAAASKALEAAGAALKADVVVVRRVYFREVKVRQAFIDERGRPRSRKVKIDVPTEVEYHVNPESVAVGAIAVAVAGLVGAVAWFGFPLPWGQTPAIKDAWTRYQDERKKSQTGTVGSVFDKLAKK